MTEHDPADGQLDSFAEFEHHYLLQYIYFADIRGVALFAALAAGMTFFFTAHLPDAARTNFLAYIWIVLGALAFLAVGIALCPIPLYSQLPDRKDDVPAEMRKFEPRGRTGRTSVAHYLDVADYNSADHYLFQVAYVQGEILRTRNDLVCEKLRECYDLAVILRDKMEWLMVGFVLTGLALLALFSDLAIVSANIPLNEKVGWSIIFVCFGAGMIAFMETGGFHRGRGRPVSSE